MTHAEHNACTDQKPCGEQIITAAQQRLHIAYYDEQRNIVEVGVVQAQTALGSLPARISPQMKSSLMSIALSIQDLLPLLCACTGMIACLLALTMCSDIVTSTSGTCANMLAA